MLLLQALSISASSRIKFFLTRICILVVVGDKGVGGLTMASLGLLILPKLVTAVLFRFLAKNA